MTDDDLIPFKIVMNRKERNKIISEIKKDLDNWIIKELPIEKNRYLKFQKYLFIKESNNENNKR